MLATGSEVAVPTSLISGIQVHPVAIGPEGGFGKHTFLLNKNERFLLQNGAFLTNTFFHDPLIIHCVICGERLAEESLG